MKRTIVYGNAYDHSKVARQEHYIHRAEVKLVAWEKPISQSGGAMLPSRLSFVSWVLSDMGIARTHGQMIGRRIMKRLANRALRRAIIE